MTLCRRIQLRRTSCPLVKWLGKLFSSHQRLFKMDSVEGVEAQALEYQKIEEVFEDKYCEVFDTILSVGSVEHVKNKLKVLKDQGTDVYGVFKSYF